jgi:hypothetical protein
MRRIAPPHGRLSRSYETRGLFSAPRLELGLSSSEALARCTTSWLHLWQNTKLMELRWNDTIAVFSFLGIHSESE